MFKQFLKGILFGASVGAVSGLFFAPCSGNETRKKLIQEIDDTTELTNKFNNSLNKFKQSLLKTKKIANTVIPDLQEDIQKDMEIFKFQSEQRIKQIQEQFETLYKKLSKFPNDM